jgi:hypothetical protein
MGRPANTRLSDDMSGKELSDTLGQMVFTAARDWQRSVTMTRGARDMIVAALRKSVEQKAEPRDRAEKLPTAAEMRGILKDHS